MKSGLPLLTCGKTFAPDLPEQLDRSEPPITIAEVFVDSKSIQTPCVLTKYSEFIQFTLFGLNPKLRICYRLIRVGVRDAQILQEWEFLYDATDRVGFGNINAIQPTVLNNCDCLKKGRRKLVYHIQIIEIETNGVRSYRLQNQSFTATAITGESQHERKGAR
ncbi:hypothetical protein [Alkalihalobacillus sp. CinArs1]|uniref:hypothetical protein n=1 Tax=Alkalihalobacillus sp. CinArs1 TaxID=2995314 RepID=UPI0022DE7F9D|nr:hypothetical protein [Alkalihalobacillus sp. CinArs1]